MKNKTQKSIISALLVLVLVVGCFAALPLMTSAAPAPVPGEPKWDAKYASAKVVAPSLGPAADIPNNPRDNASGDKITSNAHSGDYPGLYFYWDDKQKDNGVLLVSDWVFDLFVDGEFTLTAKNSNNYWGYTISEKTGQKFGDVYAYGISKQIKYNEIDNKGKVSAKTEDLKNINMVFIDGKYKSGYFEIVKNWYDEEGIPVTDEGVIAGLNAQLKFNGGYKVGKNEVKISDYITAVKGAKVTVTETVPEGYFEKNEQVSQTITVKYNDDPTQIVTFNNQKKWAEIEIVKIWLDVDGNVITDKARLAEVSAEFTIGGEEGFVGKNKVVEGTYVVSETGCTKGFELVSDNDLEAPVNAGKVTTVTFVNQEKAKVNPPGFSMRKTVDGVFLADWTYDGDVEELFNDITFELRHARETPVGKEFAPSVVVQGKLDSDGILTFDGFNFADDLQTRRVPGYDFDSNLYAITEILGDKAKLVFQEIDAVYFEVSSTGRLITNFDFDATYTIVNGYNDQYIKNLQYGQNSELLDANGNIFYIGVNGVNKEGEAVVYDSFCAHAGSQRFAGNNHLGCSGYIVALVDVDGQFDKDAFLAAYNYIEVHFGPGTVNDKRVITQVVTWCLLGAIDVDSDEFAAANLTDDERAAVIEVMANYKSHKGNGPIVDIAYMICETHGLTQDGLDWCQPQLVPIYGEVEIRNTPRTVTEIVFQKWINNVDETVGANFRFVILDSDDNVLATVDTDADGIGYHKFDPALPAGEYTIREEPVAGFEAVDDIRFVVDANGAVTYVGFPDGNVYFVNIPRTYPGYVFRVVTSTDTVTDLDSRNHGTEINEDHPLGSNIDVKGVWYNNLIVWGTDLTKDEILEAMQVVVTSAGGGTLTWTWDADREEMQTATNQDGAIWSVTYEDQFYVGNTIDGEALIYFGADDAVIIEINGEIVAWSFNVLGDDPNNLVIQYPLGEFQKNLEGKGFTLYAYDLAEHLIPNSVNKITIIALNQNVPPEVPESDAASEGNPCGLLLTFEVRSYDGPYNPWA